MRPANQIDISGNFTFMTSQFHSLAKKSVPAHSTIRPKAKKRLTFLSIALLTFVMLFMISCGITLCESIASALESGLTNSPSELQESPAQAIFGNNAVAKNSRQIVRINVLRLNLSIGHLHTVQIIKEVKIICCRRYISRQTEYSDSHIGSERNDRIERIIKNESDSAVQANKSN